MEGTLERIALEGFENLTVDVDITDTRLPNGNDLGESGELIDLFVNEEEEIRTEQIVSEETEEMGVIPETSGRLLAYSPELDAMEVIRNKQLAFINPELAAQELRMLESRLMFNQEVYVMERWRAPIGKEILYDIHPNEEGIYDMYPQGENRSLVALMERGIKHRAGKGLVEDSLREYAEREGAIQLRRLAELPIGAKAFSFSPPSGSYRNDFFDGFELCEDDEGNPFIRMQRFATSLTPQDYQTLIPLLTDGEISFHHTPSPVELLARPVFLPLGKFTSLYDVRNTIHRQGNLDYTDGDIIDEAIDGRTYDDEGNPFPNGRMYMKRYIDILFSDPLNQKAYKDAFRAMINFTDAKIRFLKYGTYQDEELARIFELPFFEASFALESRDAMYIESDCGDGFGAETVMGSSLFDTAGLFMGGPDVVNWAPFSVADFGKNRDWMGSLTFHCPACGYENTRPYGKTIKRCENPGYCKKRNAVWCGIDEGTEDELEDGDLVQEKLGSRTQSLRETVRDTLRQWFDKGNEQKEQMEQKAKTKEQLQMTAMN